VFEDRLNPDAIEHTVLERQLVSIGHQSRILGRIHIRTDEIDGQIAIELTGPATDRAAADDENRRSLRLCLHEFQESFAICSSDRIAARNETVKARPD
jgi:hypothetical protein